MRLIDAEAIKHFAHYIGDECYTAKHQEACAMAIAALRAQQDQESKPLNGWISVKDRLPEKNQAVLGWYKDNPFAGYTYGVVSWNGRGWVFVYAQRYVTNVTHWMPLPKAPETKKTKEE